MTRASDALACFAGVTARRLLEVSNDPRVLERTGWWAVVIDFEGVSTFARFADVDIHGQGLRVPDAAWPGIDVASWESSMSHAQYTDGVEQVRDLIAAGDVYQVNLCRMLSAPMPAGVADLVGLARALSQTHAAPHAGVVCVPEVDVHVASASPELFLRRVGSTVTSSPIKGTARVPEELLDKDVAENVMIVDLVRNDLGRVCATGDVHVDALLALEHHPGLVHLVSTVSGVLRPDAGWPDLLEATFPPGSVSGAPKSSALRAITELEPVPRGPYCGAVGWVDADRGRAELAVGIRSFFLDFSGPKPRVCFGTGAGITWGSDPELEWAETVLKADRLLQVAARATKENT
ncbi:MAG: chorismate-binding protein [Actinomycetes bacterium]